jgi:ribosomal protein S18 acetylase RimI-like enzyme
MPDTDLPIYRSDIRQPLLNGVLRVRNWPIERAVQEARRVLSGSAWSWWVGPDSDAGTEEGLLAAGGRLSLDMPVMAIDVTTVAPVPTDLKIQPMTGRAELREYAGAYSGPLGFDPGDLEAIVDRELNFAYPDVVRLGCRIDGQVVGTCTLSLGAEVGALYCIATDPAFRRRGVATALTLEALRITRESGRRIATLQASSEGEPVYRGIGFETVARYRLFDLKQ